MYSPEPKHEAEIEIAANGGQSESGSSDQGRGPSLRDSPATVKERGQESEQEVHSTTFFFLRLAIQDRPLVYDLVKF